MIPILSMLGMLGGYIYDKLFNESESAPVNLSEEEAKAIDEALDFTETDEGKTSTKGPDTPKWVKVDTIIVDKVTNNPTTNSDNFTYNPYTGKIYNKYGAFG